MQNNFDYHKLKEKMKECKFSIRRMAESVPMATSSLSTKLSGQYEFTATEMRKICEILEISMNEITGYFFATTVRNNEPPGQTD